MRQINNSYAIFPIILSLFLIIMTVLFIFGDLGVLAFYEKNIELQQLHSEIINLKIKRTEKFKKIHLLKNDLGTIRKYALLYGMVGGKKIKEKKLINNTASYQNNNFEKPFLLRHPVLIIIVLAIFLLIILFLIINKKIYSLKTFIKEKEVYTTKNKKNYIKPSWS